MAITTTMFLDAVKRGVTVPATQYRFTDADILKFGDEETEATVVPLITSVRQEFFVYQTDIPTVDGKARYKIPYRAIGRTLRDIKLSRISNSTDIRNLSYISPEDAAGYNVQGTGDPWAFTVRGDDVIILPTPSSTAFNIQMFYGMQPSYLVPVNETGIITAIDTVTGIVTISAAVTGFTTGALMDFVDGKSGCSVLDFDIANTNVSGTAITFDPADLPDTLEVGDYVTIAQQTPVLQFPDEVHQVLVEAVVGRLLEALGDFEGLKASNEKLAMKKDAAQLAITPRVESKPPVVINSNGLLRRRNWLYRPRYTL